MMQAVLYAHSTCGCAGLFQKIDLGNPCIETNTSMDTFE